MDSPLPRARERRRSARYGARLPVALTVDSATMSEPCFSARTKNLSENGVLLHSNSLIPEGSRVKLTVDCAPKPLLLTLDGEVLRVNPRPGGQFAIAVACDFPLRLFRPWP